jgi:hypothetical protein
MYNYYNNVIMHFATEFFKCIWKNSRNGRKTREEDNAHGDSNDIRLQYRMEPLRSHVYSQNYQKGFCISALVIASIFPCKIVCITIVFS